jgi:hypothetical protein
MHRPVVRRGAILAVTVVCLTTAAGCNKQGLTRRELVVHFAPSASASEHDAARSACATAAPHASPEPAPTAAQQGPAPATDVRFRVDQASDRDINQLLQCLRKQPGVLGFDLPDANGG